MGCGQSKIEGEEAVTRCKERKEFMKKAVSSRNAFAAAHSLYTISLKNTGAALSDYGQGEAELVLPSSSPSASLPSTSAPTATIVAPIDTALPPPPPHPDYHQAAPLQRAASMPDLPIPKKHAKVDDAIDEDEEDGDADDEEEDDDDEGEHRHRQNLKDGGGDARVIPPPAPVVAAPPQAQQQAAAETSDAPKAAPTPVWLSQYFFDTENIPVPSLSQPEVLPPPPLPREEEEVVTELPRPPAAAPPVAQKEQEQVIKKKKKVQHQHAASVGGGEGKRGRTAQNVPSVTLVQVLDELDVHFLKASESAHDVSKMLEATRMHYHSNFADNRGHIDHSARLMRVITWNRSCKNLKDDYDRKDDFDNEESETHATILDKMLAWEKKLYDEVKAGELMKIEYQRKTAALSKQKKRGASPETLEKTKAAVSHLHTRYIVDMQSMDSTVSEINRLRDKQLYPKLVDLVDGMAKMWETMFIHHSSQYKIAGALRNLDISVSLKETSGQHYKRTQQLWQVLFDWHSRFQNLMKYQKEYIQALNDWLKLNLVPIESSLKEKVSSPPRVIRPAIQPLLLTWHDLLGKLPDERARGAIHTFTEVVDTILVVQLDELKLKEKCEDVRKDYIRKKRAFDDWYRKYSEKKAAETAEAARNHATEEQNAAVTDEAGSSERPDRDEVVVEREAAVESLMVRLREEEDEYRRTSKKVREKSIGSLKTHLPELFRALSEFANECSQMYKKLRSLTTETVDTLEAD